MNAMVVNFTDMRKRCIKATPGPNQLSTVNGNDLERMRDLGTPENLQRCLASNNSRFTA
jgi:hypothetical protein